MNEAMALSIKENTDLLIQELSRFDYLALNHIPAFTKWSVGEIAEHVFLLDVYIITILRTESKSTQRDPQENIEAIVARLTDISQKFEAPNFLIPSTAPKNPQALIQKIINSRNELLNLTRDIDLTKVFPESPHPLYGIMSGIEWINFLIIHTNRHIKQVKTMK